MFEVVILTVNPELTRSEFDTLLSHAAPEKQKRIKQYKFYRDAQNCLLGDILTRVEICRATGINSKNLEFAANNYGKPFLVNDTRIHFNISHSEGYVVCAVSGACVAATQTFAACSAAALLRAIAWLSWWERSAR